MSKTVQILLSKPLVVHLDKDEPINLAAGLQTVSQAVADHWYVQAHSQPVTHADLEADETKKELEVASAELQAAKTQLIEATATIAALQSDAAAKNAQIAELQAANVSEPEKPAEPKKGK